MPGFDVLDPHLDVKRSYFLEASAGTGKTFTIENLTCRLIQEGMSVDKILIVTFTRAATLELKLRIRKRLEEKQMHASIAAWDEAKIFTIHGFCFHTLKAHAFETGFPLSQNEESAFPDYQKRILKDFLRTSLPADEIHPRQLDKALKKGRNQLEAFLNALTQSKRESGRSYSAIQAEVRDALPLISGPPDVEELIEMASCFKGFCDRQGNVHPEYREDFKRAAALLRGDISDLSDLPLIKMVPSNLKQKQVYPQRLEEVHEKLIPLLAEASDSNLILGRLKSRASQFLEKICLRQELFFYDDLVAHMQKHVHKPDFASAVRSEYEAVLIDEFQDTDPRQWDIFSTLFLNHLPLYLVGDPKQSIYGFRGADLYTYLEAKKALGEGSYATLTRNFRSEPTLVDALNILFQRAKDLIRLPKTGETLTILPIVAARDQTHQGKVIFCRADDEESLFAFIVTEIERLKEHEGIAYRECAILVKDRYQAQKFCSLCSLPFVTQKNESLLESEAFFVLEDLLLAILNPRDRSLVVKALGGPLLGYSIQQLGEGLSEALEKIYHYHAVLTQKGILFFFQLITEELTFPSTDLYQDMWQLVEMISESTTSVREYLPYLQKLKLEDPEAEILKTRAKNSEDAIQIMTLHVSKGLEFTAVFPIGLMRECEMEEEEELSEKMRQLYVACTRAKRYLYLPVSENTKTPIHFFLDKMLQGEPLDTFVKAHPNFSLVPSHSMTLKPKPCSAVHSLRKPSKTYVLSFPPCKIHSYSSLTQTTSHTSLNVPASQMPAGPEIGLILHTIFEHLDFSLRGELLRDYLVKKLEATPLAAWLESVEQIVENTLLASLPSQVAPFCLAEVNASKMITEMEFLYPSAEPQGFLKGFIDLFFEHQGYYYCLDWKSNFLNDYTPQSLEEAIATHNYALQASIYQSAARKYLKLFNLEHKFVGSFYLFLRGTQAHTNSGIYFFSNDICLA